MNGPCVIPANSYSAVQSPMASLEFELSTDLFVREYHAPIYSEFHMPAQDASIVKKF